MVRNNRSEAGTKHVNCRFHYVRELRNDNILELIYVKSEDNEADMMCKNPTEEVFTRHTPKLVRRYQKILLTESKIEGGVKICELYVINLKFWQNPTIFKRFPFICRSHQLFFSPYWTIWLWVIVCNLWKECWSLT